MSFLSCLLVVVGGAMGSLARYAMAVALAPASRGFPWGTLGVNVIGSFVIGLFGALTLAQGRFPASENARLFVMVGVCGGFTTFSSFSLQTFDLLRTGAFGKALLNVGVSVVLCLGAVAAGQALAQHWNPAAQQIAQIDVEEDA